jgi:REP element-mobilizing transposase RayT
MSKYIYKSHNVTVLLYHIVFPTKYRKVVIDQRIDILIKETCLEIEKRYEVHFLEIGTDRDHIHLLVQSIPTYNVTKLVTMIRSITAREVFKQYPDIKKQLWGGEFWSAGYFTSAIGKHGSEKVITDYVKQQGQEYTKLRNDHQLTLF